MSEPMNATMLAEIRRSMEWGDYTAENTADWVRDLLGEVDRLRTERDEWRDRWEAASTFMGPGLRAKARLTQTERELWAEQRAIKRITADDFAEKIVGWLTEDECWGPTNALNLDFDGTANHLLAKIRAEVADAHKGEF